MRLLEAIYQVHTGIGKMSALLLLLTPTTKMKVIFLNLGNMGVDFSLVLFQALINLCKLFGISKVCADVEDRRYEVLFKNTGKSKRLALKNLPPAKKCN